MSNSGGKGGHHDGTYSEPHAENENILAFTQFQNEDPSYDIKNDTNRETTLEVQKMNLETHNLSNQEFSKEIHNYSVNVDERRFHREPRDSRISHPTRPNGYGPGSNDISPKREQDSMDL